MGSAVGQAVGAIHPALNALDQLTLEVNARTIRRRGALVQDRTNDDGTPLDQIEAMIAILLRHLNTDKI